MADNTKIEWADHTFNPWEGCQKVSPGCDHCYAETRNARYGGGTATNWGPSAPRRRTSASNWRKPLAWQRDAHAFHRKNGRRQRVFCASLADVFDNAVDPAWRLDLGELIAATPDLDWLLLTKRIGNADAMLRAMFGGSAPANVWLGASIVNQEEADRDIPKLLAVPARVRFLSMEPLLGPVDLSGLQSNLPINAWLTLLDGLDWIIVGGESGPGARPMHPDWVRSLRDQCADAEVPFFFKQWGDWAPIDGPRVRGCVTGRDWPPGEWPKVDMVMIDSGGRNWCPKSIGAPSAYHAYLMARRGKAAAGRRLDGVTHDGFPPLPPSVQSDRVVARADT